MRPHEILTESLSRIAYHYSTVYSAATILETGKFQLTSMVGSDSDKLSPTIKTPYYLSTTRSKTGGYHSSVGKSAAMFVLDGNWFNDHNYVSKPVDYWGDRDTIKFPSSSGSEAEDRVFSKSPTIPIDGVLAVHIYVSPKAEDLTKARARQALISAKKRGIKAYFYTDPTAWKLQDTRKVADVSVLTGKDTSRGYVSTHRGFLMPFMELLFSTDRTQLGDKAKSILNNLDRGVTPSTVRSLKADFSNARKPNAGTDRKHAVKITDFMRNHNLGTLTELVDYISKKWEVTK